jgi:type I restriction enzyme S subunit
VEFEALGELPKGWRWRQLQDLAADPRQDIVDGPFGSNLKASEYVDEGVPIARLQNVDRNQFIDKNIRCVTEAKASELARHGFQPGDILLTKLGDPLGKACIVPPAIGGGVIVADLVRIRPDLGRVDRKYLNYALNSPAVIRQLERHTKGTTRPRVNLSVVRELPIPVAPRHEQEAVVAEIEKQFSRLDEAVANLKRVKANAARLVDSVLIDTTAGRLVQPLRAPWRAVQVREAGQVLLGRQRAPQYLTGRWPRKYLRVANIKDDAIDFGDVETMDFDEPHFTKYRLAPGDILVSEGQSPELLGQSAIFRGYDEPLCFQKTLHRFRADPEITTPEFAQIVFRSHVRSGVFRRLGSITTNIGHLTLEKFKAAPFPLPPLDEQHRIVAEVDRRLSIVREVEAEVDANLKRAQALRQAVLARAFAAPRASRAATVAV